MHHSRWGWVLFQRPSLFIMFFQLRPLGRRTLGFGSISFPTDGNVTTQCQTHMMFEHLGKRTLLTTNRDFITSHVTYHLFFLYLYYSRRSDSRLFIACQIDLFRWHKYIYHVRLCDSLTCLNFKASDDRYVLIIL